MRIDLGTEKRGVVSLSSDTGLGVYTQTTNVERVNDTQTTLEVIWTDNLHDDAVRVIVVLSDEHKELLANALRNA